MTAIALNGKELSYLSSILNGDYKIILFGSRVLGTHTPFSDLDICLKSSSPISDLEMSNLREVFQKSELPFTVDIVDYLQVSESFRAIINRDGILLRNATPVPSDAHEPSSE